jgi:hypothetical protein
VDRDTRVVAVGEARKRGDNAIGVERVDYVDGVATAR